MGNIRHETSRVIIISDVVFKVYVIIMGGGSLGLNLAKDLIADGHDVTLIEKEEERCKYLVSQIDVMVVCGSATDKITLENAEITEADAFVAATGNDDTNLLASLMARNLGAKKIIARVNETQHEPVFASNNFINIIVPESVESGYLEKLVLKPKITDLFVVDHGKAELLELYVTNSDIIGKTIGELNSHEDYFICGVHKNDDDNISIATSDTEITDNCRLAILVRGECTSKVLDLFTK
jgi:trk system potassium uptake protein TrkA